MGFPFSKIIQNGEEYDVNVSAPSRIEITSDTRLADISSLIENSINKGFIPYIAQLGSSNAFFKPMHLYEYSPSSGAIFTSSSNSDSVTGGSDSINVNKINIRSNSFNAYNVFVGANTASHSEMTVRNMYLYYR